ncbi:MAG: glycosyltransferase family 4 protein [Nitritalea sp.]
MNIGIEAQRIFRPKKHGMDIVVLEALRAMQRQENLPFRAKVFVQPDADPCLHTNGQVEVQQLGPANYVKWEQRLLPQAAEQAAVQLLHTTSNTGPTGSKIPLIVTIHDVIYLEKWMLSEGSWYQRLGNLYRRWNVPKVAAQCQHILTVSDYEKERIQHYLRVPEEKISTVYNACSAHFFTLHSPEEIQKFLSEKGIPNKYVLYLGNTDPKKNLKNVLHALSLVEKAGKLDFKLVMPDLDAGYLRRELALIGNPKLREAIHLTGYLPNKQLPYLYQGARCFLYPSLRESFGIPMLEAMASGCPLICSETSAMPEIAGDAAYYVNPHSAMAISEALQHVLSDAMLRKELIEKGHRRAASFSWENTAQKMIDIYMKFVP